MTERSRLAIVYPHDEIKPELPPLFQRAAKRCTAGDVQHRGLLAISATLARFAVDSCAPPGARHELCDCVDAVWRWARSEPSTKVRTLRERALSALPDAEHATELAIERALHIVRGSERTPLDAHADRVALRYGKLAAHFSGSAVVLAIDAIEDPRAVLGLPDQIAGALAYKNVGLGPARSSKLREQALQRAVWESGRGEQGAHAEAALAVQLFHEFLGALWKTQNDAQKLHLFDFIAWAFPDAQTR
jgi:hypothetical protein